GSVVRLKDIARIQLGGLSYKQAGRLNGKPACIIAIFQAPGSNALAVAKGVKQTMAELKQRFPADLDYAVSLDQTLPVTEGIREIVKTLGAAIVLVILVVFLFLQNWRATLIPMIAVPVAISVVISAFTALTLSPALAALLLKPRKESKGPIGRLFAGFNQWFARVTQGYVNLSHALIRKGIIAVAILLGFVLLDGV